MPLFFDILKRLFSRRSKNSGKSRGKMNNSELSVLSNKCNKAFQNIFAKCRLEFGREIISLMDIKRNIMDAVKDPAGSTDRTSASGISPLREMIARKILQLTLAYFELASSYVSVKTRHSKEEWQPAHLEDTRSNMNRVYGLISSLNRQFYLRSGVTGLGSTATADQELINEAEALCNVLHDWMPQPAEKQKLKS